MYVWIFLKIKLKKPTKARTKDSIQIEEDTKGELLPTKTYFRDEQKQTKDDEHKDFICEILIYPLNLD